VIKNFLLAVIIPEKFESWLNFASSPPLGYPGPDFPMWHLDEQETPSVRFGHCTPVLSLNSAVSPDPAVGWRRSRGQMDSFGTKSSSPLDRPSITDPQFTCSADWLKIQHNFFWFSNVVCPIWNR
jgi:hypothetical protein